MIFRFDTHIPLKKTRFMRHNFYFPIVTTHKVDFQEVGCRCTDWIELAQDMDRWLALVNAAMNLRVP